MMTAEEYLSSLRRRRPMTIYYMGERVADPLDHPVMRSAINAVAATYALAEEPEWAGLMTGVDERTGNRVNRFTKLFQSRADLQQKTQMQRLLGRHTGTCFQRCVGMDALSAVESVTYEIDARLGTDYHGRFLAFLDRVQREDLTVDGAMTDVKGDRSLRPGQQHDPDLYLRVVEQRSDGIVVRGAKGHQTGVLCSHEMLVMPTAALRPGEEAYAVCFSIPVDAPGLVYIHGRQASDTRAAEGGWDQGNLHFSGQECLVVFDDAFVPWERVYMLGEVEGSGLLVERFATLHRQSYAGCKAGMGDVLIGAAAQAAEYSGVHGAPHVKDKLVEMVHLNETIYAGGVAAAGEARELASGTYLSDPLLSNMTKLHVTRHPYEIARLATDLAGGLVGTLPSQADFAHPVAGPWLQKYLATRPGVAPEARARILRLIENLVAGRNAVSYLIESVHGAGSPQAQRVVIARSAGLEQKKAAARRLCGAEAGVPGDAGGGLAAGAAPIGRR